MHKQVIFPVVAIALLFASSSLVSAQVSDEAFDQMSNLLAGEWSGTLHVSEGERLERLGSNAAQALTLNYSVRSGGSSIL